MYQTHIFLGITYIETGRLDEGIQAIERAEEIYGHFPTDLGLIGYAYAKAGQTEKTQTILRKLEEQAQTTPVPAISFALIYQGLEDVGKTFDWLEKTTEEPHVLILELYASPIFDSLRSHPRYQALLRKMNLKP